MAGETLPPALRVIARGMLNSNLVVLREHGNNVLVDSGYCTRREQTLELLAGPGGLEGESLERLVNTHCHADHVGGNAAVASVYGCRITIPAGEAKHVSPWTRQSVWMEHFDQRADPFHFDDTLSAGDTFEAGGFEWDVYAAPGHDMDALMFFEPMQRILISGDALWEKAMGFVWPEHGANAHIEAARETLATIERLAPAVVIPGHGEPFTGLRESLATVRSRLDAFERDPVKNARHVAKVVFVFALLDRGAMPVADVPGYLESIPIYRDLASGFIGTAPGAMAEWMLAELALAGAIALDGSGTVRPAIAA